MMNNTYSSIISQSERAWNFQWARTLLALERQLSEEERLHYLRKYSINMSNGAPTKGASDNNDDTSLGQGQFVPGLMIIKRANCTRAERRRHLIGLWQVSLPLFLASPIEPSESVSISRAQDG